MVSSRMTFFKSTKTVFNFLSFLFDKKPMIQVGKGKEDSVTIVSSEVGASKRVSTSGYLRGSVNDLSFLGVYTYKSIYIHIYTLPV